MSIENQRLIDAARRQLMLSERRQAQAKGHAKIEGEQFNAELTLLLDDLKNEGVDIRTPQGMGILARVLAQKKATNGAYRSALEEEWPEDY